MLRQYCQQHNKNEIHHYQDDYSAKNFNRPAFQDMLAAIRNRTIKPNELICVRPDRFSRNLAESINMIKTLKSFGVDVIFLEQNFNLSTPENLIPYILSMVLPQVENERRGLNTKQGMRQALRQGRFPWKAPKGYNNDKINKTIEKNNDAKFIYRAFNEVALNIKPIDVIRKQLNKEGFKCCKQQFINLLRNPFYAGKVVIKEWSEEPEQIVNGLHKAIVDKELYEKVQDILRGRRRKSAKAKKYNSLFPLRGHLICKKCGSNLTASSSSGRNKKYHYYHCQNGCNERINATLANTKFNEYLEELQINNEIASLYSEVIKDVFEKEEGSKEGRIRDFKHRINSLENKLTNLDDKFLSDSIPADDYKRMSKNLKTDIKNLTEEVKLLKGTETNLEKHFSFRISILNHLLFYFENAALEIKHKLIGSIFPEKLIFDDEKYRTIRTNSLISLICSNSNTYGSIKKRQAIISDSLSNLAPLLDSNQGPID